MACSALMLMANKLSVHHLPKPGIVLLIQFLTSAFFAKSIGVLGLDEVDELTWDKVKRYCPAVGAQLMTIFSGIKVRRPAGLCPCFLDPRARSPRSGLAVQQRRDIHRLPRLGPALPLPDRLQIPRKGAPRDTVSSLSERLDGGNPSLYADRFPF